VLAGPVALALAIGLMGYVVAGVPLATATAQASQQAPCTRHKAMIVAHCGHNARCIFTTDAVLPVIFPQ